MHKTESRKAVSAPALSGAGSRFAALTADEGSALAARAEILRAKPFLNRLYREWYERLAGTLPERSGPVLELGSGGSFLREFVPGLIASDILLHHGLDIVADGCRLPFTRESLRGILMTNVFHHLPSPVDFLAEALRCVRPGGVVAMIEPWNTFWSRRIYRHLHYERFDPSAQHWEMAAGRPLAVSNNALAWIIFCRDRQIFKRRFPAWSICSVEPMMPLRYLLSGGVTRPAFMPAFTFGVWRGLERMLGPGMHYLAMFACIVLEKEELTE